MNNKIALLGIALASALATSCGDDGDSASCPTVTGCGGNIVGAWDIKQYCISGAQGIEVEDCPDARVSLNGISARGTVTYDANMTYQAVVTTSGSMVMSFPTSCIMGVTCAQLNTALSQMTRDPDSDFSSVNCTGSNVCNCTFTFKNTPSTSTGTWQTMGNTLIEDMDSRSEYCVQGSELRIKSTMPMSGMMGMMGAMGMTMSSEPTVSAVLTKK